MNSSLRWDQVYISKGVTNHWTGTLDWTTGLTYFWFLHILRLLFAMSLQTKGLWGAFAHYKL